MNYRDERDALRGRIEGLEEDLQDARRLQDDDATKRARIEQVETRMRDAENNLRAMRAELEALGASPRPKKTLKPLLIAVGVTFLGAAMGAYLTVSAPSQKLMPTPPVIERAVALPAPLPTQIPEIPKVEPLKPPAPARQIEALWAGKVTSIKGLAGSVGISCIVNATLENQGAKQRVAHLSVKCGNKTVYDSSDQLDGMSMTSYGMAEEPGKEAGTYAYAVKYTDTGARSGPRTQASIDTTQGQGVVWSEIVPIFRVEFSVPTLSAPVKGEALIPAKPNDQLEVAD